jgi:thiol-disulfide isomerase/thioredoxin
MNAAAPELVGNNWINAPDGQPLRLAARRGKVTVVEFWTFGCVNCRHNLPAYARWHKQFSSREVLVIGVHTPETDTERLDSNVGKAVKQLGIEYPILLDNQYANWQRWNQHFWPTVYLVDKQGRIRYRWEGELSYGNSGGEAKMAALIEELVRE